MSVDFGVENVSLEKSYGVYRGGGKRVLDIVLGVLGLVALSPVMLLATLAILLESGGPVIFRQNRCGKSGKIFTLYKLRSMTAPKVMSATNFDAGSVARVTKVGRILRKTKLDETLQLYNVLKGDMSIIGPRPEVPYWVSQYPSEWAIAHTVKPGLSDWASLKYRNEEDELAAVNDADYHYKNVILPGKLSIYINYVNLYSFQYDAKLILRTIKAVVS